MPVYHVLRVSAVSTQDGDSFKLKPLTREFLLLRVTK
jgi:hypothetical protein